MFRTPAKRAMALVVTGAFALGAAPALANVQLIYQNASTKKRKETQWVATSQTEEVRGEKQFVGTTPHVEEQATGPASKLVTESEIRRYQVPVTTHPLSREESREITTTTTNYIRRTTTSVVDSAWPVWVYYRGGAWDGKSLINSTPTNFAPSQYADANRRPPEPYMAPGQYQEYTAQQQSGRRTIYVEITPEETWMKMRLAYDTNLNYVAGYFEDNPSHGSSEVKKATVIRYHDHDAIQVHAVCNRHGQWWRGDCGTNYEKTFHLNGFIVKTDTRYTYRDAIRDESYQTVSDSAGPWTPTGRLKRGAALTNPGLRYEPLTETVLLRRYQAMNHSVAPKQLATSGNDVRKTFSADKSSGKDQAVLSGSKMRQGLGANRVTPSRVAPKGAGAPALPLGPLGELLGKPEATPGRPQPTPKPRSVSWWFPRDPQTPPPSVRYASYVSGL